MVGGRWRAAGRAARCRAKSEAVGLRRRRPVGRSAVGTCPAIDDPGCPTSSRLAAFHVKRDAPRAMERSDPSCGARWWRPDWGWLRVLASESFVSGILRRLGVVNVGWSCGRDGLWVSRGTEVRAAWVAALRFHVERGAAARLGFGGFTWNVEGWVMVGRIDRSALRPGGGRALGVVGEVSRWACWGPLG